MKYDEVEDAFLNTLQPETKLYTRGDCVVLLSPPYKEKGWRMSISCSDRELSWKEIRDAWYDLVPDADSKTGAMFFPPKSEYVNLHICCFHIHEIKSDAQSIN